MKSIFNYRDIMVASECLTRVRLGSLTFQVKRKTAYMSMYATNQFRVRTCSSSVRTYATYANCQTQNDPNILIFNKNTSKICITVTSDHYCIGFPSQFNLFTRSDVRRVRTYTYFYWRTHDFGNAYVDTYAHFFPMIFLSFQIFSNFFNFILFKNLLLYI